MKLIVSFIISLSIPSYHAGLLPARCNVKMKVNSNFVQEKKELHDLVCSKSRQPISSFLRKFPILRYFVPGKKKLLILISDTGGGHRASAQAIHQALNEQFPRRFDVDIMDIWTEHAKPPFNTFVPVYRFVAKHPMLWRGFYLYGMFPPTKLFTEWWSWKTSYKSFQNAIEGANPDFVLSVHPLCQLMPLSIVGEMNKKRDPKKRIPFVTVVTDLGGAHTTWFDKRVDAVWIKIYIFI